MSLDKARFTQLIQEFKLKELFNELGWDRLNKKESVSVSEDIYTLEAIAEKRDFVIFSCSPNRNGKIPDYSTRKKIENKISKLYFEHLLIYNDADNHHQIWQLAIREPNKPITIRETPYFSTQYPELLFQKLSKLFISIDEEEKISLLDVKSNVVEQFNTNAEKVTKRFYDEFKKHHGAFLSFIKGIEDKVNKEWYASLMLNRLMFIYFIQKKGFLDNNSNYLQDKLKEIQERKGKDKFFSFYRSFLLVLFHKGLGSPEAERSKTITKELGKVPYLNGGLFDVHQIEKDYNQIEIEDKAFKRIFKFFDEYNWHLDTKITATGRDINPDVIGYIFEKYINDRASMGAYYTKEDITEYITKNTIIPYLFDQVKKDCANAFKKESSLWKMLRDNPDRYIYDAVKHGIYEKVIASARSGEPDARREAKQSQKTIRKLPAKIEMGIDTTKPNLLERRKAWNKSAQSEYALPTEIWREVVERRNRYFEIKSKIENGEIKEINDFITYNLNIRQFAQDAVEQYEGSDFINAFHKSITKITVLDPTCGSGAFLFAALNILEPLYESCLLRMRAFVVEDNAKGGKKFSQFRKVLDIIEQHPNEKYFIFKSIILNNLFGVDIMNEAVEIAKLRLFLKLVAEVDVDYEKDNMGLEPLPDIDFNIRAGNTLVGFTSYKEIKDVYQEAEAEGKLMFEEETKLLKKIEDQALVVSKSFKEFKEKQTIIEVKHSLIKETKIEVQKRLVELNDLLNKYKAYEYGIDADDLMQQKKYNDWLKSHQPFHWFSEFYEIIESGGFDVIIGNPPYLEQRQIKYRAINFNTLDSNAIHAMCIERSAKLTNINGNFSMIVPLSIVSTQRMKIVQNIIERDRYTWYANFAWRPAKLFDTVNRALTIFVSNSNRQQKTFSTGYQKWISSTRGTLMYNIKLIEVSRDREYYWCPKFSSSFENNILTKIFSSNSNITITFGNSKHKVFYRTTGGLYWKVFTNFAPKFKLNGKIGHSSRQTYFSVADENHLYPVIALLSSNTFWWWYTVSSNLRDLNPSDINNFLFPQNALIDKSLIKLGNLYLTDLKDKSIMQTRNQKQTGKTETQLFVVNLSKPIIDEIDKVLAEYYGFTEEELDFIINYDIKYRMGKELEVSK